MKCFKLLVLFITLYVGISYTINCDEAKTILNIEYDGNCCDLQQINCDESNENILSIESLLDIEDNDNDYDEIENEKNLYRRKGGGRGGGGRSSGSRSSGSKSSGSKSSGSKSSGSKIGGSSGGRYYSSANSINPKSFLWALTIILLIKLI
ncbi:hypothetical protein BCR32DRAFT_47385 [Anaeromyces robustus]|uniref:Uncharacterized protein n=1 Tax=Anaeromyces robustus TaxID=1754192 RepID=A0A1Y1XKY1_9FUNG|nr:hypothetical protein BCR32DRAFT_47385 [Anaeromyces robustus]|eukprot:ORX86419.1 hypothetical protein BCR32DRAFT_47385 [Anaeromyces robustus]